MSDRGRSHSNHVPSRLMRESLVDKDLIAATLWRSPEKGN